MLGEEGGGKEKKRLDTAPDFEDSHSHIMRCDELVVLGYDKIYVLSLSIFIPLLPLAGRAAADAVPDQVLLRARRRAVCYCCCCWRPSSSGTTWLRSSSRTSSPGRGGAGPCLPAER